MKNSGTSFGIVTNDKKMSSIIAYVKSIGHSLEPVLITGKTGVGKGLVARAIHEVSKCKGKLVTVNVAGLDDTTFSDTLFGHTKGAFAGADRVRHGLIEKAAGGTLFLDEIGGLTHASQMKLLRLLQGGEYLPLGVDEPRYSDARIIASTNKDIWTMQREGLFRNDLNYRLRTHHVHVPSLRDRRDDIPLLVDHFLSKAATAMNKKKPAQPEKLLPLLRTYSFPGNIRELESMIFDAFCAHKGKTLSMDIFNSRIVGDWDSQGELEAGAGEMLPLSVVRDLPTLKQTARLLVAEALKRANGNQSVAAGMLGVTRQALSKRLLNYREAGLDT